MPNEQTPPLLIPKPFLDSAPLLRLGDVEIRGIAAVRRKADDIIKDPLQPFVKHVQTLFDRLKGLPRETLGILRTPGAVGQMGSLSLQWLQGQGIPVRYSQETVYDMWPIPGLQEVYYDYTPPGGSGGRATFYIPDYALAEASIYILQEAAIKGDKLFQVFLPVLTKDGGTFRWVLSPVISGPIQKLEVNDWPFSITVQFGDTLSAASEETATPEEGSVVAGKTPKEVLEALLKRIGVTPIYWPPAGPPALTGEVPPEAGGQVVIDVAGRPYVDVIEDLLASLGLSWRWLGTGILPPLILVYERGSDPEVNPEFLQDFVKKKPSDLVNLIAQFGGLRWLAGKLGLMTTGFANVLAPISVDPHRAKVLASFYVSENEVGGKYLKTLVRLGIAGAQGVENPLPFLEGIARAAANAIESVHKDLTRYNWAPILELERFSFQLPTSQDIGGGPVPSPFGVTEVVNAQEAARRGAANVKRLPNGRYQVEGLGEVDRDTPLLFAPSGKVASPRVIGAAGGAALSPTGETSNTPFYPYSLVVRIPPYAGIWAGMPTLIVGMRPLDGWWEAYRAEYILNAEEQYINVYLRTNRPVVYF